MPDSESLPFHRALDMALDMAVIVGFAIPGGGVAFSVGAAAVKALLQLFMGGQEPSEVEALLDASSRVGEALVALQAQAHDALWEQFRLQHQSVVDAVASQHALVAAALLDGRATGADMTPVERESWQRQFDLVKAQSGSTSELLPIIEWIAAQDRGKHKHQLTTLYLLTVGVYLSTCRLSLMIEEVENAWDLEQRHKAWRRRHPEGDAPDDDPEPLPLERGLKQIRLSTFFKALARHLTLFIGTSDARIRDFRKDMASLLWQLRRRRRAFSLEQRASGRWFFTDGASAYTSPNFDDRDTAELAMDVARGKVLTSLEHDQRHTLGLEHMDARMGNQMRQVLHELRQAATTYELEPSAD